MYNKFILFCGFLLFINFNPLYSAEINSVSPSLGYTTTDTLINIKGEKFYSTCSVYLNPSEPYVLENPKIREELWWARKICVSGNYIYITLNRFINNSTVYEFAIIDKSDPKKIIKIGSYKITNSSYNDNILFSNNHVFLLSSGVLQIFDVSNPNEPKLKNTFDVKEKNFWPDAIYISYNQMFLVGRKSLIVQDITNPASPVKKQEITLPDTMCAYDIKGNYLYIIDKTAGLEIIDLSVLPEIKIIGKAKLETIPRDLYVFGNYVYTLIEKEGIDIFDITDRTCPKFVSRIKSNEYIKKLVFKDNYVFIGKYGKLLIADISTPLSPKILGEYKLEIDELEISGDYLIGTGINMGLYLMDIRTLVNPALIGTIPSDNAENLYILNKTLYIADGDSGMAIVDISEGENPKIISKIKTPGSARDVFVKNNFAYVADWDSGLQIIDVSDLKNPKITGSIYTPGRTLAVYVSGNYAYLGNRFFGMDIVDITNPSKPILLGNIDTPGAAVDIEVKGNFAYVADWEKGFHVIDIKDPSTPVILSSIDKIFADSIFIKNNYAYITGNYTGMHIVDLSIPENPKLIRPIEHSYFYHSQGKGVYVSEDGYAYIANGSQGLLVADVSNPIKPKSIGKINNKDFALNVAASGDYIYLADRNGGVQVINKFSSGLRCVSFKIIDTTSIDALVPKGLVKGTYNIKVVNETGEEAVLKNSFKIK